MQRLSGRSLNWAAEGWIIRLTPEETADGPCDGPTHWIDARGASCSVRWSRGSDSTCTERLGGARGDVGD
jgi:hypothetical protein